MITNWKGGYTKPLNKYETNIPNLKQISPMAGATLPWSHLQWKYNRDFKDQFYQPSWKS